MLNYCLIVYSLSGRERTEQYVDVMRAIQRQEYLWRVWRVRSVIEVRQTQAPANAVYAS